jgi:hypothetical protein
MGKNHFAGKFMFANLFKPYIFLPFWDTMVEVFFPLWDTTEEFFSIVGSTEKVFLHCGIQWKRFSSIVGYNGEKSQDG